jgi:hypothetical protein
MDRRTLIRAAAGGVVAPPFVVIAQSTTKIHRIGVLVSGTVNSPGSLTDALRDYRWLVGRLNAELNKIFASAEARPSVTRIPGSSHFRDVQRRDDVHTMRTRPEPKPRRSRRAARQLADPRGYSLFLCARNGIDHK